MKIQDVNNLSSEEFIENFNNIFEKTSSIAISSEKNRTIQQIQRTERAFMKVLGKAHENI